MTHQKCLLLFNFRWIPIEPNRSVWTYTMVMGNTLMNWRLNPHTTPAYYLTPSTPTRNSILTILRTKRFIIVYSNKLAIFKHQKKRQEPWHHEDGIILGKLRKNYRKTKAVLYELLKWKFPTWSAFIGIINASGRKCSFNYCSSIKYQCFLV